MRSKFVVAALSGLFMAGVAFAQTAPVAAPPADPQNILNLDLSTGGRVKVLLRPDKAPYSVERIKVLTRRHFYDGLTFHRVIEGFMAQGGDPKGTGEGGSDLPDLKAEFNDLPHVRGTMALARAEGLDTANSQFFIMLQPNLSLDGNYTAIGRVTAGMEYVDALAKGEPPENPSKIIRASIESDEQGIAPAAFVPPAPAAAPAPVATGKKVKKEKKAKQEAAKPSAPAPAPAPEPAPQAEAAPATAGTDAAVREVSGEPATAAAVKDVASEEAIATPK
ncbi:peptidylprolyl isomerase [Sphingomonas sp. Root710]|nr:peptidylprolyl isomerase [Sphingomonas sp. Root710]KRB86080.1 peptidylprolyl isomerase [Sphingomonas sp. Root710]